MKLLVVDGNSILNRAFYGIRPLTTKDGQFTNAIYGFLIGASQLSSIVAPSTKVPAAIITSSSYPAIGLGTGVT